MVSMKPVRYDALACQVYPNPNDDKMHVFSLPQNIMEQFACASTFFHKNFVRIKILSTI